MLSVTALPLAQVQKERSPTARANELANDVLVRCSTNIFHLSSELKSQVFILRHVSYSTTGEAAGGIWKWWRVLFFLEILIDPKSACREWTGQISCGKPVINMPGAVYIESLLVLDTTQ